jgi:hypothetical protein
MTNLKILELDGDPYWQREEDDEEEEDEKEAEEDEDDNITTRPYPLHKIESIKGLEKLRLKHGEDSNCIKACGHMMLDLLPKMPNLKVFETDFHK